jgi:hypothetical protein
MGSWCTDPCDAVPPSGAAVRCAGIPYVVGERWREYYAPTFDRVVFALWLTALVVVCWRIFRGRLWRRDCSLRGEVSTLVGAWALPPSIVLFVFYARIGNMVTRYATSMRPTFIPHSLPRRFAWEWPSWTPCASGRHEMWPPPSSRSHALARFTLRTGAAGRRMDRSRSIEKSSTRGSHSSTRARGSRCPRSPTTSSAGAAGAAARHDPSRGLAQRL